MCARSTSWASRPALLRTLWSHLQLCLRLAREPKVPRLHKAMLVIPALYLISPLDLLPDMLPGIGQLDDLGVLLLALQAFVGFCPSAAVEFHRAAIGAGRGYSPMSPAEVVLDAEWRRG